MRVGAPTSLYCEPVSRSPSIWSSPVLLLALATGVVLTAIISALESAGLSLRQTVVGGALLVVLLAGAALAARRRGPSFPESTPVRAADGPGPAAEEAAADPRSLDPPTSRPAAAKRQEGVYQAGLHDPLTGLPQRPLLLELLQKQLAEAYRSGELVGVLLCDIDGLGEINESFGRGCGDRLLQEVARRLSTDVREADSVARTGEDDFTLIVGRAETTSDIQQVVGRLMAGIRAPFEVDGRQMTTSVSVGISVYPRDGEQPEQLLDNAETALAAARTQGSNSVRTFSADMGVGHRRGE